LPVSGDALAIDVEQGAAGGWVDGNDGGGAAEEGGLAGWSWEWFRAGGKEEKEKERKGAHERDYRGI